MQTGAAYGSRSKITIARLSVLSNLLLVLLKLAVGIFIDSVSVLSEAVHSGIDLLAALLSLFAVSRSATPPDEDHQYGHGKYENVSGIVEALLIFLAAAWIIAGSGAQADRRRRGANACLGLGGDGPVRRGKPGYVLVDDENRQGYRLHRPGGGCLEPANGHLHLLPEWLPACC